MDKTAASYSLEPTICVFVMHSPDFYADTDSDGESFQGGDTGEEFFTVGASI